MKRVFLLVGSFTVMSALALHAQVTIGANQAPESHSVLEISTTQVKGGVRLPQLDTYSRDSIALQSLTDPDSIKKAGGLAIFNTDTRCFEFWNSVEWISLCNGGELGLVNFSNCDLIKVVGVYDMDRVPMNDQEVRIDVPVNVRKLGAYRYSAVCNGVTFIAQGTFINLGPTMVSLYVDPSSANAISAGEHNATVTITQIDGTPNLKVCDEVVVSFLRRRDATLKILNIAGDENTTGLTSAGGNYLAGSVYAGIGTWLQGNNFSIDGNQLDDPTDFSGTQSVQVVNVEYNSMAQLQQALADASIVWVGATEQYSYGFAQLLKEWSAAGRGVIIITGDKIEESPVSDALGYYIEEGATADGTFYGSRLPQVFGAGAPFNLTGGILSIGYSGANCGYISSNNGVTLMTVTANRYPSAFADIDNSVFIFGDKFGSVGTGTTWNNFAKVLADIFAWSLKNAPIY